MEFHGKYWSGGSTGRRLVRKKRPTKWVFFFWFPLCFSDASSRSGLTDFSPHSNIAIQLHASIASSKAAPGASPGQWLAICHVIRYPRVFSPEVFRPKSELSEAFIRTSQFELWNFALNFSTRNFKLLRVHFELWNNLNFSILNYKFQTFTFTVPMSHTGHFELSNFNLNFTILN